MPIKYARPYSPRYYNPNCSQYSAKRMAWEKYNKKSTTTQNSTTTQKPTTLKIKNGCDFNN